MIEIEPALGRLLNALRRRDGNIARDTIDDLRAFGVECCKIGMQLAHSKSTIPAAARVDSRYLIRWDDDDGKGHNNE